MAYVLIENGTLIDGFGGEPIKEAAVLIKNNIIQAVGKKNNLELPSDAEIITMDANGGYILPGLIDTHVHLTFQLAGLEDKTSSPFSLRFYKTLDYMKATINAGITTVRDAGGTDAGIKQAVESGMVLGPRMQISIDALTTTGGHGDSWTLSGIDLTKPEYPGSPSGLCDGPEEVRKKVRQMLRAGADIIKVHATGGVMSPTDHPEYTQFSPEELSIIVDEANYHRGKKVMAHAQGSEGIKNAIKAGIHSIEHGIYLDDEVIELMLKHGTYLVPTLLAPIGVLESAAEHGNMPEYAVKKAREVIDTHKASIEKAYKAGVKIAMGTDAGVFKHGINLRELNLMCEIGMSPMETIVASTKTAAECMGWEDQIGTLEAGKFADIIIVNDNPIENIKVLENTDNIVTVMKDGKIVKDLRAVKVTVAAV
ncbi:amidohydrolase family protein [Cytobacillus depressus]|uniref:Amidohydrolase family protein n=1 Tax=Cytobacillus depressus TaxID=1602942 RepID=A0A6L3VC27_9BACI|nr:amidohydrolase family protein [Cytobacillus depressus]KAB2338599.1 amidohydrolase family protein [Cytobacillus depressus]